MFITETIIIILEKNSWSRVYTILFIFSLVSPQTSPDLLVLRSALYLHSDVGRKRWKEDREGERRQDSRKGVVEEGKEKRRTTREQEDGGEGVTRDEGRRGE